MKLLDILVRDLGNWPYGVDYISQKSNGGLLANGMIHIGLLKFEVAEDQSYVTVTRQQYESALSEKVNGDWNGEGLPPVGCECEMQDSKGTWLPVEIIAKNDGFTFGWSYDYRIVLFGDKADEFRPLRTEADKRRDQVISDFTAIICGAIPDTGTATAAKYAVRVYDAISAGKISGIKLTD